MPSIESILLNHENDAKLAEAQLIESLEAGASPNVCVYSDVTALMYACVEIGSPRMVAALLKRGAEVDARDDEGRTALALYLAGEGMDDLVWDAKSSAGLVDLDDAGAVLKLEVFRSLLDHGADVNARDGEGATPLMRCAEYHNHQTFFARELLERGADPDILDRRGHTALTKAAGAIPYYVERTANRSMVALLADLTDKGLPVPEDGVTPVVAAINGPNVDALPVLVEAGYPIVAPPQLAHLEPVLAAVTGDQGRLERVLGDGHPLEARTALGWTPLMWAARMGHTETVRFLLSAGADMEAEGKVFGRAGTALFTAALGNHVDICRLLWDRGARPVVGGNGALDMALKLNDWNRGGFRETCEFLWAVVEDKSDIVIYMSDTASELSKPPATRRNKR